MNANRRFHDWTLAPMGTVHIYGERVRVAYRMILTGLPRGASCVVAPDPTSRAGLFLRKTEAVGGKGSIRYHYHCTEQEALDAGMRWARRQDQREAREQREAKASQVLTKMAKGMAAW